MSLESIAHGWGGLWGQNKANKENRKAADRARKQTFDTINSLDWEPMYASDTVPAYQKTQSPVARSYLESFLAGNNPNMTFSGAPNAGFTKARQQASQDAMFGTMDQRIAQQRALEASNPYQVQTPTRPVMSGQAKEAIYKGSNPNAAGAGLDQGTRQKLIELGIIKDGQDLPWQVRDDAEGQAFGRAIKGAAEAGNVADLQQLINPKLDRPHAIAQRRQRRKTNARSKSIVAKYNTDEDEG